MIQLRCPYCKSPTQVSDASVVYRKPGFGRLLICTGYPSCDAYVGMHEGRSDAKGTLAKGPLRRLRRRCHDLLDPLWQVELPLHRRQLYQEASRFFGVREFHVGHLNEAGCEDFLERFESFKAWLHQRVKRRSAGTGRSTRAGAAAGKRSAAKSTAVAPAPVS